MLVQILDAEAQPHFVTWQGLDQINDYSGILGAGAVGVGRVPQQVFPANTTAAGAAGCRCGLLFQNTSQNAMLLIELANEVVTSSWVIAPGAYWPPYPGFPIVTNVIYVQGSADSEQGDAFAAREFVNAASE